MKGDFTRSTFDPNKHYTSVRMQQGRVPMDADWNEAEDIGNYLDATTRIDVIGRCGFPEDNAGFAIAVTPSGELAIGAGRGYVEGTLCENDAPVLVTAQDYLPDYELPTVDGTYIAYLDVWQRHITALEDPGIKEVALDGPDTATRLQTIWQVKLQRLEDVDPEDPPTCADFGPDWRPTEAEGSGNLRARAEPDPLDDRPCAVPAQAGYRRLENQLYRVEIHLGGTAGTATFKWSRDNGSIITAWTGPDTPNTDTLTVTTVGRDSVLRFAADDWVELTDDTRELNREPGLLVQLDRAEDQTLEIDGTTSRGDFPRMPKVRRWNHPHDESVTLTAGAIPITEGAWVPLEDGVEVWFEPGGTYHTGDYWLIPARTIGADVLWPRDDAGDPILSPPHGVIHHYCSLALLRLEDETWEVLQDCRPEFPPLTDLPESAGCCLRVAPGDDVQRAIDRAIAAGGGCICLGHGLHTVNSPLRLNNARNLHISGETAVTTLRLTSTDQTGTGGLLLQNTSHVTLSRLLIIGQNIPAVITLQPGDDLNQDIHLNRLNIINLTTQGQSSFPPCALHLISAARLQIEDCCLVATVGIFSLLGEQFPAAPNLGARDTVTHMVSDAATNVLTFEDLPLGTRYTVGDTVPLTGVTAIAQPFTWSNGQTTENGFAQVDAGGRAGGTGQELELNNINLNLTFTTPQPQVTIQYGEFGGNVNLAVNGEFRNTGNFSTLNGATLGGVTVTVNQTAGTSNELGQIVLSGEISQVALGGQELWIDNIQLADGLPPTMPPRVQAITLTDSTVLFTRFGIWALAAQYWHLQGCELRPLPRMTGRETSTHRERELPITAERLDLETEAIADSLRASQRLLDQIALAQLRPSPLTRGTAVKAMLWHDCQILHSTLQGDRAVEAAWWVGGAARHNLVTSRRLGLYAFWLHNVQWTENQLQCGAGAALSWVGCHRVQILHNLIRDSQAGITNIERDRGFDELVTCLREIRAVYTSDDDADPVVLWQLLTYLTPVWGLEALLPPLQTLMEQLNLRLPALYWLSRVLIYPWLDNQNRRFGQVFSALIALQVEHNDIEAEAACLRCQDFWTLGGITIRNNRLHTTTGQSLLLNANPSVINVYLLIFLWRYGIATLQQLITNFITQLRGSLSNAGGSQVAVINAAITWLVALEAQIDIWQENSEGFLEADNRIEGNHLRSLETAIATNLFGIALLNNTMTLQERRTTLSNLTAVVNALSTSPALAPLAIALKAGSRYELNTAIQALQTSDSELAATASRGAAAAALTQLNGTVGSSDPSLQLAATNLLTALNGTAPLTAPLNAFAQALTPYLGSYGILLQGIGGRVVGNQIVAPVDIAADTWSRGGLRLSVDLRSLLLFIFLAVALQQALANQADQEISKLDPLLGITETLIDNNEILGGIGHGIEIQGSRDVPEILLKLKLRDNEIGGMGGAGIFIHETALVVNLDIEGNRIADCATNDNLVILATAQAGLDVAGAVFCRLHNNRINACGIAQNTKLTPAAVNLETLFDLTFTDNSVQYNPVGGVRFTNVFGTVSVNDNDVSQNGGIGFAWENANLGQFSGIAETEAVASFTPQTFAPAIALEQFAIVSNQPLPAQLTHVQASVQSNQFHVPDGRSDPAFLLVQLNELIFTGNLASHAATTPVGLISAIEEGIVANNLLRNRPTS